MLCLYRPSGAFEFCSFPVYKDNAPLGLVNSDLSGLGTGNRDEFGFLLD